MADATDASIIRCVALFYNEGCSGKDFQCKEPFRVKLPEKGEKEITLKELKDIVRLVIFFNIFIWCIFAFSLFCLCNGR